MSLVIENYNRKLVSSHPIRKYRLQYVSYFHTTFATQGLKPYPQSPRYKPGSFYHVSVYNLGEPWWSVPTAGEQAELIARYGSELKF